MMKNNAIKNGAMKRFARLAAALAVALNLTLTVALALSATAAQAAYPDKPIHLVVPYSPGGNIDSTARVIAAGLSQQLGGSIVVDNRAGAAGIVGAQYVASAKPDGYTMLLASSGALSPLKAFYPKLNFDPDTAFASVGPIARAPLLLVVRADMPVHNLAEFIAYAKQRPGKLTMASSGVGGVAHLAGVLFQTMSGTQLTHVPYKGSSDAMADLLGGHVDLTFDQPVLTVPQVNAGTLRALGVTTLKRSAVVPDLPTLAESGLPGFEASTTTGLMFPAGTPKAIIDQVNAALLQTLKRPDTQQQFKKLGADVVTGSGADFEKVLHDEETKWGKVIHDAHIQAPS